MVRWQESAPDNEFGETGETGDLRELRGLLSAAMEQDGRPEVNQDGPLPREFRGGLHLLARDGDELIGYGHLDTSGDAFGNQVAELIVHPAHRRLGHGARLVDEILAKTDRPLRIWSHGDHPAAVRIAEKAGLARVRELLKMRLDATVELAEPVWPRGVSVRTFVPGQDEAELVAVNGRAFDWHPEQSQLTVAELATTERESWFDPKGFFLAVDPAGAIVGFHWTKVHPGRVGEVVGEVYVVGVDPATQGGGLGRALTLVGLRHLRESGLGETILYVESDNSPAVAVYSRLGFTVAETDVAYQR